MEHAVEINKKNSKCEGWTSLLLLICLATTIGTAVPVGYLLGVMNTPAKIIKDWCAESLLQQYDAHLSEAQVDVLWASIVSMFLVGGICGSFAGASCCDKLGRKGCLLVSVFLLILSGILFQFCREANSVEMLLLARFVAGIAAALIYTAHPMYLFEIAPSALRGTVGVFTAIGVTGGIFFGQICSLRQTFGTESLWQYALSFFTLLVVCAFSPAYWFPESPRWLYMVRGDPGKARVALERLRGSGAVECINLELSDMELAAKSKMEKSTFRSVLRSSELLLPLVLVCSFQACQQLSGINAIFFYSVPIFAKAGFSDENAEWMNLGAGFLNVVFSLLGPWLMSRFNRRPLMLLSCAGCGLSHLCLAFALNYIDLAAWLPVACLVFISSYMLFFQFGLGPIPYFVGSEIFEVAPRPVAMSMGSLSSWCGNFMIGMFFPLLQSIWGYFAFLPCSLICLYGFLLTWRYLPETRGRDVADLKPLMENGFKSKVK